MRTAFFHSSPLVQVESRHIYENMEANVLLRFSSLQLAGISLTARACLDTQSSEKLCTRCELYKASGPSFCSGEA